MHSRTITRQRDLYLAPIKQAPKPEGSSHGIKIDVVQLNDYVESINQYTAGQFDGCTRTNMDALTIPGAGHGVGRYQELRNGFLRNGTGNLLVELGKCGLGLSDLLMTLNLFSR